MADLIESLSLDSRRAAIAATLGRAVQGWLSLADLNRMLRDAGASATDVEELRALGFPVERFFSRTGKVKAIHVYATEAAYERGSWRSGGVRYP